MERLRVIDASVMPDMVTTNTNAAAIMIGEKGADLVIQRVRSLAQAADRRGETVSASD